MKRYLKPVTVATASFAAALLSAAAVRAATTCEGLINLSLPHGQITAAQTIAGGTFQYPAGLHNGQHGVHHEHRSSAILPCRRERDADERLDH